MPVVFDTNILVDYLNGVEAARDELSRFVDRSISLVTWMEVLAGARDAEEEDVIEMFLCDFEVVEINRQIARHAVQLRRANRLRLPDALILATAQSRGALLVTRNTRDFDPKAPGVRVPYQHP